MNAALFLFFIISNVFFVYSLDSSNNQNLCYCTEFEYCENYNFEAEDNDIPCDACAYECFIGYNGYYIDGFLIFNYTLIYFPTIVECRNKCNSPVMGVLSCSGKKCVGSIQSTQRPKDCLNPDGASCNWYRDCLESRYNCEEPVPGFSENYSPYAIKYAEKYCLLYDQNYAQFSINGRKWVDEVRKCLQVNLATIMSSEVSVLNTLEQNYLVCSYIKEKGFDSHVPCYLKPSNISNDISMCNLDCSDMNVAFKTIKSAFLPFVGEFWKSLLGALSVGGNCLYNKFRICKIDQLNDWFKSKLFKIKVKIKQEIEDKQIISDKIANYVADKFKLSNRDYYWIGYQISGINKDNSFFSCAVLIVDMLNDNDNPLKFEINSVEFFDELLIGEIKVESIATCNDIHCQDEVIIISNCDKIIISNFLIIIIFLLNFLKTQY
jgi:hypothetical protein